MNRKESGISFGRILKILLIIMGVLIIGTAVFFWFYIHKNAKLALRDAKNVYMALNSVEIELSYDEKNHQILVMQYRLGYYLINFYYSPTETVWEVNYMFNVYRLED